MNAIPLDMLADGAAALGIPLTPKTLTAFDTYAALLLAWNKKINLTTIVVPQQIVEKHFLDSLSIFTELPSGCTTIIDIGSGGGFPGLPIAIVRPDIQVTLVEATEKKASFLRTVISTLALHNVTVHTGRAETIAHLPDMREHFDVAVARAVAQLATLAELTIPFVRLGGVVIAQKSLGSESVESAFVAIETLGGTYEQEHVVALPALAERRLVIIRKTKPTLAIYPRRVGIPAKKPIGN